MFIAAVYHPPKPCYSVDSFLEYFEASVTEINDRFAMPFIVVAGDLNSLSDEDIVERTGLIQIVHQPTRGGNLLDRIFVTEAMYPTVRVITSTVRSDHKAVVVYSENSQYKSKNSIISTAPPSACLTPVTRKDQ